MKRMRLAVLAAAISGSACASLNNSSQAVNQTEAATSEAAAFTTLDDGQSFGALTDSALPEKSCGMILWTLDEKQPIPVFRYVVGGEAEIEVGGRKVLLTRTNYSGGNDFGVYENQTFASNVDLSVNVEANFASGFDGGSYLERSLIKVSAPDGSTMVAPAAGVAGCRSGS